MNDHNIAFVPLAFFPHSRFAFSAKRIATHLIWTNTATIRAYKLTTTSLVSFDACCALQERRRLSSVRKQSSDLLDLLVCSCSNGRPFSTRVHCQNCCSIGTADSVTNSAAFVEAGCTFEISRLPASTSVWMTREG